MPIDESDEYDLSRELSSREMRSEIRLIGEINAQVKSLGENFRDFAEKLTNQIGDVRERLARIEQANMEYTRTADRLSIDVDKLKEELDSDKEARHALTSRIVRIETIIAPLTVIGGAIFSLIVSLVAHFTHLI